MLMSESGAQRHTEPISVYALFNVTQTRVIKVVKLYLIERIAGVILIYASQSLKLQLLARVHEVVIRKVGKVKTVVALVRNLQLALGRSFCLDYYNAVGSLRTVDGCRRSILKQGDRSHTVHVKVHNSLERCLKTIKNEERLVGIRTVFLLQSNNTRLATYFYVWHLVRIGTCQTVVHNLERGVQCLQALKHVLRTNALKFVALECGRRSGEALLLTAIDTRHDYVLDVERIRLHRDTCKLRMVAACISYDHLLITDKREHDVALSANWQRESSVNIGCHCVGGSFDSHRHANHRLIIGTIKHTSFNKSLLYGYFCRVLCRLIGVLRIGRIRHGGG